MTHTQTAESLQTFLTYLPSGLLTQTKIAKLTSYAPENLFQYLTDKSPKIAAIVGDSKAIELFSHWQDYTTTQSVLTWLLEHGLDNHLPPHFVQAIVACHGEETLTLIQKHPYALLGLLDWHQVDGLSQGLGIPSTDPDRLTAAVEAALHRRLEEGGHTWTDMDTLLPLAQTLLGNPVLTQEALKTALRTLQEKGQVVSHKNGWQTGGCWQMEQDILDVVRALSNRDLLSKHRPQKTDDSVEAANQYCLDTLGHGLGQTQKDAIRTTLTHRFSMVAGYAGSGKTTALKGIAHALLSQGQTLYVLALSARAAKRAGDAAGIEGKTIAGFLKQLSLGAIRLDQACTLIIDEASMLDLPSLWKIVRKLNGAGLVLVGDPEQIPPIGFGLTLHALLKDPDLPATHLDTIYRQDEATGIPYIANLVRQGHTPAIPQWTPDATGISHYPCTPNDAIEALKTIGRDLRDQGVAPDDIQILPPIKAGLAGVHHINRTFHTQKQKHTNALTLPGRPDIAVDDPVVWTKNNPQKQLWNGSLGRILDVKDQHVLAMMDGETFELSNADTQHLDLAYALSVHRAQGSQWHTILLPIFPSKVMSRALLYTALTRATQNVILIGTPLAELPKNNTLPQTGYNLL